MIKQSGENPTAQPFVGNIDDSFPPFFENGNDSSNDRCEVETAQSLLRLGILFWRRGDYERSDQLICKAKEISTETKNLHFLAQCYIGLALVKTRLEQTDEAITAYQRAVTLAPANQHLWNNIGSLYLKHKKYQQALDAYKKAVKNDSNNSIAWFGLANTYYHCAMFDEAIAAYEFYLKFFWTFDKKNSDSGNCCHHSQENYVTALVILADLYTKKHQHLKAFNTYQKALAFEPKNDDIWHALGVLHLEREENDQAIKAFVKTLEINMRNGSAYLNLALLFTKLGKYEESIAFYKKSILWLDNQKEKELATGLLDNTLAIIENLKMAIYSKETLDTRDDLTSHKNSTCFYYAYDDEMISFNTSHAENIFAQDIQKTTETKVQVCRQPFEPGEKNMLSLFKFAKEESKTHSEKIAEENLHGDKVEITDPNVWNEKGNFYFRNQDYKKAIIAYKMAIDLVPSFGKPYNNLALIHLTNGNYQEAISLYLKSIDLLKSDREKAVAWNGLGNAYRCAKDYENARRAYKNASKLDNLNGGVYDNSVIFEADEEQKTADFWNDLGKLFFKSGIYDKAISAFQEAIKCEPTSAKSYSHLARTLATHGQYKDAIPLFHRSIDLISDEKEKANIWYRIGDVYRKMNDYDNALQAYQNASNLANDQHSLLSRARFSLLVNCITQQ